MISTSPGESDTTLSLSPGETLIMGGKGSGGDQTMRPTLIDRLEIATAARP
jgi:hypothetical protein